MEIQLKPTPKRSNLLLFFDHETAKVLESWLISRKFRNNFGGSALFPSKQSQRMSGRELEATVKKHAARVGLHDPNATCLKDKFSPHCCRYWFTTHLYRAGMSREYIMFLRGDAPLSAFDGYNEILPADVRRSYLAHIPQLGI